MKRLGVAAILLVGAMLIPSSVRAQSIVDTSSASKVYIGLQGGFVLSMVWGPDQPTKGSMVSSLVYSLLPGVSAGLSLPIMIRPHFVLEPELLFTTRGVRWTDTTNQYSEIQQTVMWRENCIEIPVLAKLVMWPSKRIKPVIYAGPDLSVTVQSYTEYRATGMRRQWSMADTTFPIDVGAVAGLAAHIKAGRGFFIIDLRGGAGILDQNKSGDDIKIFRNLYAVGYIGYCFNPKKKKSLW